MNIEQTIPVANLQDFRSGDPVRRARFIKTVGDALEDIGFFALEEHGVDTAVIEEAYAVAEEFFGLSEEAKNEYALEALKGQRGYTPFGTEHAKDADAPDLKEFWHVGRQLDPPHPLAGSAYPPNVWPNELQTFRPAMEALYASLDACAAELLEACALHLDLDEGVFRDMATDGQSILRVIHYPPIQEDVDPASVRAAAHEDINFITLLCESTAGGLELLQRDGAWRPIHALAGQIVVDAGDMLQHATNGLLRSTTHRVVNPDESRERRFSMPFFVHPRPDADITPLADCVARTGGKALYPSRTAGAYLTQRLREIGLG